MAYSFIPAGAVLTISGPMYFHLVPHSEGTFVPAAQPQATPSMAPTYIPAAMPQSTPTLWPSIDFSIPSQAPPLAAPPKAPVAVPSIMPAPAPHAVQMANYTVAAMDPHADLDPAGTKEKYLREVVAAAEAKGDDLEAKKAKEAAEAAIAAIDAVRKAKHEAAKLVGGKADATLAVDKGKL